MSKAPDAFSVSPPSPLYLIHGPEELLRREAISAITAAVLDDGMADFNLDRFDAPGCDPRDVVAAARTLPVMAQMRLVIVRGIEKLKSDGLAALADYVADPSPTTCLVLEGEKADMRKAPFSKIKKAGQVVACQPLWERDIVPWLAARARAAGRTLTADAARFLAQYAGGQLATLASELDKAAAFAGEGQPIDLIVVEETVGGSRVHTVFELTDALGERHAERALLALSTLLDAGEAPLKVQAMIVRQFRLIWRAVEAIDKGRERDLAQTLGVAPFLARKLSAQARRFREDDLVRAFRCFAKVDFDLKGGAASPRQVMEMQVLALCGRRAGNRSGGNTQAAGQHWH